ncbi:MAG: UvrD-helicase domain-containing protein [Chloroflexota bacterium]
MIHPIVAGLNPNEEQLPAITRRDCDIVVTAGAGTGKTLTLVCRYLSLLAGGLAPRQIAAITFTRKAAREMRNRVRQAIDAYLRDPDPARDDRRRWEEHYNALDAARIGTIHSLCAEILRAHPAQAVLDPRFTLLEEGEGALIKLDAVEAALTWGAVRDDVSRLFALFGERGLRQIIDTLLRERPKTRAIFDERPDDVLAHWRTSLRRRQQRELEIAISQPVWQEAVGCLQSNKPANDDDLMAVQRQDALAIVAAVRQANDWEQRRDALRGLDAINLRGGSQKNWPGGKEQVTVVKDALRDLRNWWRRQSDLQTLDLGWADEALASALPHLQRLYERAEEQYLQRLRARRSLDFDDLEVQALALLRQHEDVCRRWRAELRGILVDEYQDTNGRQRDLINLLNGQEGKLFIVGDAKQSIYRFRGADITVFREERKRIAQLGHAVQLSRSYRAHARLISTLNTMLQPVLGHKDDQQHAWQEPFAPLHPTREKPVEGLSPPFVELHLSAGSKSKGALDRAARALSARLLEILGAPGCSLHFGDVAILCQASSSFAAYENALDEARIPYVTVAGRGFFNRPEIRDLLNALQAIADPHDDLALTGLLRSPVSGLTDGQLLELIDQYRAAGVTSLWQALTGGALDDVHPAANRIQELVSFLHPRVGRLSVADTLKRFLDHSGYRPALRLAGQSRALHNVDKLLQLAHASAFVSTADFLQYISELRGGIAREGEARIASQDAVQIMSVHQAKGLQFPILVLGDITYRPPTRTRCLLDDELGFLAPVDTTNRSEAMATAEQDGTPAVLSLAKLREDSQQAAEWARLLYVAATRVREKLLLNGVVNTNRSGNIASLQGWLGMLEEAFQLGQSGVEISDEGDAILQPSLALGNDVACHIYEPNYDDARLATVARTTDKQTDLEEEAAASLSDALVKPVVPLHELADKEQEADRVWRVLPSRPRPDIPRPLLGNLVHEALKLWRFPSHAGDRVYVDWMEARVRQFGIVDEQRVNRVANSVIALLRRFQKTELFNTISRADRRLHEVPFTIRDEEGVHQSRRIDLMFQNGDGWHVVDFKSDRLNAKGQLERRLDRSYKPQLRHYARAVQQLLGVRPICLLCMLDYRGRVEVINLDEPA